MSDSKQATARLIPDLMEKTKVAIVGMGTVGSGVARILLDQGDRTARHAGRTLWLQRVVVRDVHKPRDVDLPDGLLTARLGDVLEDREIRVVAQLIGDRSKPLSELVGARVEAFPASGEINRRLEDPATSIASIESAYAGDALVRKAQ